MQSEPQTLYHYCRPEVFHSIVRGKSVWLSSLTQSNDYLEGKLLSKLLDTVGKRLNLSPTKKSALGDRLLGVENSISALGICLSSEGDVLSQWRAYAGDGTGVSIGFSREYLEWRRCRDDIIPKIPSRPFAILDRVIYDEADQCAKLIQRLQGLMPLTDHQWLEGQSPEHPIANWNDSSAARIYQVMESLADDVFLFKGKAFIEEQEWRLFLPHLEIFPTIETKFRAAFNQLIPYREMKLEAVEGMKVIDRVFLGPKHRTPIKVVHGFLDHCGFQGVDVTRSEASYQ